MLEQSMTVIKPVIVIGDNAIIRFQRLCYLLRQLPIGNNATIHHPNDLILSSFKDYIEDHGEVFQCGIDFTPMMTTNALPKAVALHPATADPGLTHLFLGLNGAMLMVRRILAGDFDSHEAIILDVAFDKVTVNAMFDEYAILIGA